MTEPTPPTVVVRVGGWQRAFPPGREVVIGRDVRADVRIPRPVVERSHVVLRYHDGEWTAYDASVAGVYVGTLRVASLPIRGGETVNVGDPQGPRVTFDLGESGGAPSAEAPATVRIGRAPDNDLLVSNLLASNHHATVTVIAACARVQRENRFSPIFVNGVPVKSAPLHERDVVTIANDDFVYEAGHLAYTARTGSHTEGLEVRDVGLVTQDGTVLLDRVAFSADPGTVTAVIGPAGSGRSTLAALIAGFRLPTAGSVRFEGHDLHANYPALRSRIGTVATGETVHRGLTVAQALGYTAELRTASDVTTLERQQICAQILDETELTAHADSRVDALPSSLRMRAEVAVELLTGPSLIVLDEPTSGLDPALDRDVMVMLRDLAAAGRVVVVVTSTVMFLGLCDQVVLMAPGGRTAYVGAPADIAEAMGSNDFADVFSAVAADPAGAQARFLEQNPPSGESADDPSVTPDGRVPVPLWRQTATLARRQATLIAANRGYVAFLAALPFIAGLLPLAAAGDMGEFAALQIRGLTYLGALIMGTTLSVREIVCERRIFRHEQEVGLSATAYVMAKIGVCAVIGTFQAAVLITLVTSVKGAPPTVSTLGDPRVELFVATAATCAAASAFGLLMSSLARTLNQAVALAAVGLLTQIALAGGLIGPPWSPNPSTWLPSVAVLVALFLIYTALTRWCLRPRRRNWDR